MDAPATDRQMLKELLRSTADQQPQVSEMPDDATLSDYLAGRLPEAGAERIRSWVVGHPEAAARLLELEPFVRAAPASTDVANFEARAARRHLEQRLAAEEDREHNEHHDSQKIQEPPAGSRPNRWLAAAAAFFFITTCGLTFRVFQIQESARRPVGNLRTLQLLGDVRGENEVKIFTIVVGEPFRLVIYPTELPAGCNVYSAELHVLNGPMLDEFDLQPNPRGDFDLLLPGEIGARNLKLTACGKPHSSYQFELMAQ